MNCPKCGVKIKKYDWRQNCRNCGTNLFLHDFDKRLAEDSVQAEIDFKWWTDMTDNFMNCGIRDKLSLTRLIASLLPLIIIPVPVVVFNGKPVMMLNFLLDILGGGSIFPEGFSFGDMFMYRGLGPAMIMIVLSLLLGVIGFFSVLIGPAFLRFRSTYRIYCAIVPLAVAGTLLFNFAFLPDFIPQSAQALTGSFGLYIYVAAVTADLIFMRYFISYSKKFTEPRQEQEYNEKTEDDDAAQG